MDVTSATRDTGQSVPGLDPQSGDVGQGLGHHEIGIDGEDPGHENATEGQGVYYIYFSNGFSPLETWDKATSSDQLHYFVQNFRMIKFKIYSVREISDIDVSMDLNLGHRQSSYYIYPDKMRLYPKWYLAQGDLSPSIFCIWSQPPAVHRYIHRNIVRVPNIHMIDLKNCWIAALPLAHGDRPLFS